MFVECFYNKGRNVYYTPAGFIEWVKHWLFFERIPDLNQELFL